MALEDDDPFGRGPLIRGFGLGLVIALFKNVALSGGRTLVEKTVR